MKRLMKLFFALVVFFNAGVSYAQSKTSQISDEEVKNILLNGTPEDLKNLLDKKIDVNSSYGCHSMLNHVIQSLILSDNDKLEPNDTIEKIKMVIEAGADVNKEMCKMTPLAMTVTIPEQIKLIEKQFMIALNANINSSDGICTVNGMNKPCIKTTSEERFLMRNELHQTIQEETRKIEPYYTQIADILLQHGADIDKKSNGVAPLHFAANVPHGENPIFLKYLLAKGADVNIRDFQGSTPLFVANFADNKEVIDLLIQNGADVNIRNNKGVLYKDFKTGEYYNFD